ncbi:tryptophanyl-tRNA synthetase [Kribbella amoyensis]|uniref:Tryptophan--tRNA ligase n=1 Tax=Kribbella amoyensis TaxID=996641 RepID=A0A561BLL3_9ACTN|nr:tryptophan--tRNA ligase [Kribbella amoyensis]TWD79786.1 tryptophanyl-tRNA synthetase [Kribbella amoyensis]
MTTLSGITPSGRLTLGNHLGALRRFTDPDGFYFVANLHAMTTKHDPRRLAALTRETATLMLAAGLPPGTVFVQSDVPAHAQLAYLLECTSYVGELSRMIQYKEKGRGRPMTRASLFTYPCLMAADILLYGTDRVPVGGDQDQHVELARDVAIRFNREYGETFVVPRLDKAALAMRVKDLANPRTKMSKSDEDNAVGTIRLLDPADVIRRQIMRAVTDSGSEVRHDDVMKPGVTNLLEILAACTDGDPVALADAYTTYGALKKDVADAVLAVIEPLQKQYAVLAGEPGAVDAMLAQGRDRAIEASAPRLRAAVEAMGLAGSRGDVVALEPVAG